MRTCHNGQVASGERGRLSHFAYAEFIDLHLDLEVPVRPFGYDPAKRHSVKRTPWPFLDTLIFHVYWRLDLLPCV